MFPINSFNSTDTLCQRPFTPLDCLSLPFGPYGFASYSDVATILRASAQLLGRSLSEGICMQLDTAAYQGDV